MFARPSLSLSLLLALMAGAGHADTLATSDQIIAALSGNTVQGSMSDEGPYTEFYAADGTIKAADYTGKWMAEGEGMCFFYGEDWDCWGVRLNGTSVTWVSTSFSCCANPCTTFTRLGMRSARRVYWFTTSDQAALTVSSWRCIEL